MPTIFCISLSKFTMSRLILYILCLLFPVMLSAQEADTIRIHWEPLFTQDLASGMQVNYKSFAEAQNHRNFASLPVHITSITNEANVFEYNSSLSIIQEAALSTEEQQRLTDIDLLKEDYQLITEYHNGSVSLVVLPMKYVKATDQVILLQQFQIQTEPIPAEEPQNFTNTSPDYTSQSVLSDGTWFRIGVLTSGVHQITYNDLQMMGVEPSQVDVEKIGIFGNYTGMLPESNKAERPDDLQENSIELVGMDDGQFNENDYILFYGQEARTHRYNPFTGRFDHFNNLYTDTTYYFLTPDAGNAKNIQESSGTINTPTTTLETYVDYYNHDRDLVNLISSGKEWFGERFNGDTLERHYYFSVPHIDEETPVIMDVELVVRAFTETYLEVFYNQEQIIDSASISRISNSSSLYARKIQETEVITNSDQEIDILIRYLASDETSMAWLNYLSLNLRRKLHFDGGQMLFRDPHTVEFGARVKFNIQNANNNLKLWDITDNHNPLQLTYNINSDLMDFTAEMDSLRTFVLFDHSDFHKPVSFEPVTNQNLHGIDRVDFVIISPEEFMDQAERLAQLHRDKDGLVSIVLQPQQIYNEFSSGAQDISGIRDFMRMLYVKGAFNGKPPYLLMFGDASFDYKHRIHHNTNIIPTFETIESLRLTQSYVSDDFFGLLDEDEGQNATGTLDVGVGRFPIHTYEEAKVAVDKIEHYMSSSSTVLGDWKNTICFVADDEDHNLHLHQAEQLVSIVDTLHDGFNINKIYSDAYKKIKVPGGFSYPESNRLIDKQVHDGALVLNYTGHGGLIGWSAEVILDVATIRAFDNINNTPLFITATCEFSRFDDPEFTSAGELVFLNPNGAGIGLLTTTRLAYAHANIVLNTRIYQNFLEREDGSPSRLGDLIRLSKTPSNANFLNFSLLGDPALRLSYPSLTVGTLSVAQAENRQDSDTLKGMSLVHITGEVLNSSGQVDEDFQGYIYPKVYDKPSRHTTLANSSGSYPEDFYLSDRVLFNGKTTVADGLFEFTFMVPKDISYQYGYGKVSYYGIDTLRNLDAWGGYSELMIGGLDESAELDYEGPEISIFLNDDTSLGHESVVNNSPMINVVLADEQGIHATGNSLGRDIVMVIDQQFANSMIMNEYFQMDVDSYQQGRLDHQLAGLGAGWHSIYIKAWDLQNNSSEKTIDFYIEPEVQSILTEVKNYPNPFINQTYFSFRHQDPESYVKQVEIKIYDMQGRNVVNLIESYESTNPIVEPIYWDGKDSNGNNLQSGLFIYDVFITDSKGITLVQHQKLIKMKE